MYIKNPERMQSLHKNLMASLGKAALQVAAAVLSVIAIEFTEPILFNLPLR